MKTTIQITFLCHGGRTQKKATFPLRKRKPEQVANDWIKEIKKEMNVEAVLEVIANGEDITHLIINENKGKKKEWNSLNKRG